MQRVPVERLRNWNVTWSTPAKTNERQGLTWNEVLDLIQRLHALGVTPRPVVEIWDAGGEGPSLSVSVGGREAIVTIEPTPDPPYFISVGDPDREGLSEALCHGEQQIEHHARNLVPWDAALKAVACFLESQERTSEIEWETL